MSDKTYCYPNSNVLKNKLNIKNSETLFEAEKELTYIRLLELQTNPIKGTYNYDHLKEIHRYIFQDVYEWAGELRTVEIGKGNLFCTTQCLESFGRSVFEKYYDTCFSYKDNIDEFIRTFSSNYADLNALHPFREGNGRTQREFARLLCLECGYILDLSCTTHKEMLEASILSFNYGDNLALEKIFSQAIIPINMYKGIDDKLKILTADDLTLPPCERDMLYEYYENCDLEIVKKYTTYYREKSKR